MTASVKT